MLHVVESCVNDFRGIRSKCHGREPVGIYFMGLNVSNEQIAHELALNGSDVQQMTAQLREGIVKNDSVE